MSAELYADAGAADPASAPETVAGTEPMDRVRPNVAGDLPTLLEAAPMFRRTVAGYDRFQVDTYVQWAEDELATADRERVRLEARLLDTRAALEEARELLAHTSSGGELLRVSRRIGTMLASAADEAESIRAEAEAARSAASAEADRMVASAARMLAVAEADAADMVAAAAAEVGRMAAEADRVVREAEQTRSRARAEAEARLEQVRASERRAAEDAGQLRQRALEEASAALLQARGEVVRMLSTGWEERRRADAEADLRRERLDRDAAERTAALLAEVRALEHRRAALRADVELLAEPVGTTSGGRLDVQLRRLLDRLRWRSRSLQAP